MKRLFKGSIPSGQRTNAAGSIDLLIFGDGTGPSRVKEVWNAGLKELGLYVKCGGVRETDAEWAAAQPYLWRQPNGQPYTQGQYGWAYGDIQRHAMQWADNVVIPHIQATLAQVPEGTYKWIMVDNCIGQHPSLFVPSMPTDYSYVGYHDATLSILMDIRMAFPTMKILANGWQGWAPIGYRGEALGATSPNYADGIWFEGLTYKTNGAQQDAGRFQQDQGVFLSMLRAGKIAIWDEPGTITGSGATDKEKEAARMARRKALGFFLSTTAVGINPDNGYWNESGTRWMDWWRGV